MRIMVSVALLASSLAGCVGHFASEHIESRYHRCLEDFQPLTGVKVAQWDALCEDTRRADYDYRLSARRFVPTYPHNSTGSSCEGCTQRVIVVPGY